MGDRRAVPQRKAAPEALPIAAPALEFYRGNNSLGIHIAVRAAANLDIAIPAPGP